MAICEIMQEQTKFDLAMIEDQFSVDEIGRITGIIASYREIDLNRDTLAECAAVLKVQHTPAGGDVSEDALLQLIAKKQKKG